jgi:hypothetical protein
MKASERIKLLNKLKEYELTFPVEHWKIEDIHVWPLLKEQIFFSAYNISLKKSSLKSEKKTQQRNLRYLVSKYLKLIKAFYFLFLLRIKNSKFSFSSASSHRVFYEGDFINKYFYPIMKYLEKKKLEYNTFEYKFKSNHKVDSNLIYKLFPIFNKPIQSPESLFNDETFLKFLDILSQDNGIEKKEIKQKLSNKINMVNSWANLYDYIFKKTDSAYSFGLCYYSDPMFGMNLAAHRNGVISIDMQHGTQGPLHFAYTYHKLPKGGYNTLPHEFWCWDQESASHIQSWISDHHKVKICGNPWLQFINETYKLNDIFLPSDKPLILFTHQPLSPALDDYLLETIQLTKDKFNWWIRLHPRISNLERKELVNLIKNWGLNGIIEIEKAGNLPLPYLLNHASIHISKFSGSIIEGVLNNTPTIILEEVGVTSFESYIDGKKTQGLPNPTSNQLVILIDRLVESNNTEKLIETKQADFRGIVNEFI